MKQHFHGNCQKQGQKNKRNFKEKEKIMRHIQTVVIFAYDKKEKEVTCNE